MEEKVFIEEFKTKNNTYQIWEKINPVDIRFSHLKKGDLTPYSFEIHMKSLTFGRIQFIEYVHHKNFKTLKGCREYLKKGVGVIFRLFPLNEELPYEEFEL
tara:strand:+ start:697 stop:999 length:303 start_codon:yes stop_codon:yes gene_type:complete